MGIPEDREIEVEEILELMKKKMMKRYRKAV